MTTESHPLMGLPGVSLAPLSDTLSYGTTITGLMLKHLEYQAVRQALYDLFVERGVLVFRGNNSHELQIEVSKCMGELESHPYPETWVEGHPELVKIKYFPDDGTCYEVDGQRLGGWIPWHKDQIYNDRINRGGCLRPERLSHEGGRTGFLDQVAAYERLPESLKERIDSLHVVYNMDLNLANAKFFPPLSVKFVRGAKSFNRIASRSYQYPRVVHPLVYSQPGTGRKVLNLSPSFAIGIYEDGGPEGDHLLRELIPYCTDEVNAYYHAWSYGDMVLWDNWRVLHYATGVPEHEARVMYRTTIAGDYGLGRSLGDAVGDLEVIDV